MVIRGVKQRRVKALLSGRNGRALLPQNPACDAATAPRGAVADAAAAAAAEEEDARTTTGGVQTARAELARMAKAAAAETQS